MSITLPNARGIFMPQVPDGLDAKTSEYLKKLVNAIEMSLAKEFDNVATLVNTGTSGIFIDSAGATVTVDSGIIVSLT